MREPSEGGGGGKDVFTPPPGSPGAIRAAAGDFTKHGTAVGDLAASARRTRLGLDSSEFSGSSAEAYAGFAGNVERLTSSSEEPLTAMGRAVGRYADLLEETQRKIRDAAKRHDAAAAHGQSLADKVNSDPNRSQAQVDTAQRQIDAATADAQAAEDDARRAWETFEKEGEAIGAALSKGMEVLDELPEREGIKKILEAIEPESKVNELIHTMFDSTLGHFDRSLDQLVKSLKEGKDIATAIRDGILAQKAGVSNDLAVLKALVETGNGTPEQAAEMAHLSRQLDALEAFGTDAASDARLIAGASHLASGLKIGVGVTGVLGDVVTMIDPPDKGVVGVVDRAAAGVNAGLLGASLVTEATIPGGQVLLVGTGAYLAGNYLYHHWAPFRHVCNDVGHGAVAASKWVAHGAEDLAKDQVKVATTAYHEASHVASSVSHGVSSGLHKVASLF